MRAFNWTMHALVSGMCAIGCGGSDTPGTDGSKWDGSVGDVSDGAIVDTESALLLSLEVLAHQPIGVSPAFQPLVKSYVSLLPLSVGVATISATAMDPSASVEILRTTGTSLSMGVGSSSANVSLTLGMQSYDILVTRVDGTSETYQLSVGRASEVTGQVAYLKASNTGEGDFFGYSLSMSGDLLAVGGYHEGSNASGINGDEADDSARYAGAVYVFRKGDSGWAQEAYLKASNAGALDRFGKTLSLSGNTLAVGAYGEASTYLNGVANPGDDSASSTGAAYVFTRSPSGEWTQEAFLKASNAGDSDQFGYRVAVSGDTLAVSALREDGIDDTANTEGAVYVFSRQNGNWAQEAYIKGSNTEADDRFGSDIALDQDTLVVGAVGEDGGATTINGIVDNSVIGAGAVYVFVRESGAWAQQAYVKTNASIGDRLGECVSLYGNSLAASQPGTDSVHVFTRTGTEWAAEAELQGANVQANDRFGTSLSFFGEGLVVGAPREDSISTGLDGNADDENAVDSGAAYLFVREQGTWSEVHYIKASNTAVFDSFGQSVALWGGRFLVGSRREGSSSTGVNGDQSTGGAPQAGAAYLFE